MIEVKFLKNARGHIVNDKGQVSPLQKFKAGEVRYIDNDLFESFKKQGICVEVDGEEESDLDGDGLDLSKLKKPELLAFVEREELEIEGYEAMNKGPLIEAIEEALAEREDGEEESEQE